MFRHEQVKTKQKQKQQQWRNNTGYYALAPLQAGERGWDNTKMMPCSGNAYQATTLDWNVRSIWVFILRPQTVLTFADILAKIYMTWPSTARDA